MTLSGRLVTEAISVIDNAEVLLASMTPGLAMAIQLLESLFLDRHVFVDGFDNELRRCQVVVRFAGPYAGEYILRGRSLKLALFH